MRIAGLVLAGGRSTRFGREKAMASFRGEFLIGHAARVLEAGCARVVINAAPESGAAVWAEARGLPLVPDAEAQRGPLFGVLAGLRWADGEGFDLLVTVPCDLPLLPPLLVARLASSAGLNSGAVACDARSAVQPLCAAWPVALAARVETLLAGGHPAARALVRQLGMREVRFCEAMAFWNVNSPGDLMD